MKRNKLPLMKKVVGGLLLCMLAFGAKAQQAGNYIFLAQASTFTPITGGTVVTAINADDAHSGGTMINLGFNFNYCGNAYSSFKVSSNGWLSFTNTTGTGSHPNNATAASQTAISPAILPLWDDIEGGTAVSASSIASYIVTGTAPNRVFTMEWLNWGWNYLANTPVISFQVKLYETTNVIELYYRQEAGTVNTGSGGASIGIINGNTAGNYLLLNDASTAPVPSSSTFTTTITAKPATGQMYRFTPPPPPNCTGAPVASGATSTITSATCSATPTLNLTTYTSYIAGVTYQWQSSPAGMNTWTNVGTAQSTPSFTPPAVISNTDFQVVAVCTLTGGGTTTAGPVNVNVASTPTISGATATASSYNCSGSPALTLTTFPVGASSINYQWQSSPAGQNTWTNIGTGLTTPPTTAPTTFASTDYRVQASCTTTGGGTATSNTASVTVTSATITPATATLCATNGQPFTVNIPSGVPTTPIFTENFNTGTGAFTFVNTSTGTTPAAADWTLRPNGYVYSGETHNPPTATQFIMSNSDAVGSGAVVNTVMTSPVINTNGYNALQLNYKHYFNARLASYGRVEVSTNGTTWTQVANYTGTDAGTSTNWATGSLNLDSYVGNSNFQFRFIYNAGWDWWWALDDIALLGNPNQTVTWSASPSAGAGLPAGSTTPSIANANITVTPTTAGTYVYTATTSGCGAPTATLTVTPAPFASFNVAADSVCSGTSATILMTGTPNGYVTITDGTTSSNIIFDGSGNGTPFVTPALSTGMHTYSIVSVTGTTCTVPGSGSMTINATPRPSATLTSVNPSPICNGTSAFVSVAAISSYTSPVTIHYNNGVFTGTYTTANSSDNIMVSPPPGSYTYTLDSLVDAQGCASLPGTTPGTGTLVVNPTPTATITASANTVCPGTPVTYTVALTGTGPWNFTYSDGTNSTPITNNVNDTFQFTATSTMDTMYMLTSLTDNSGCPSGLPADYNTPVNVTIGAPATIIADPASTSPICTGSGATFTSYASGYNLTYQWLENNLPLSNTGVYSGVNTTTLSISNTANLGGNTYQLVAMGQCGTPDTSLAATLNVNLANDWTGTVSTSWNNGMNWSCGTVPVITTNATILTGAPFMPIVDISNAMCNNLTLQSATSLSFQSIGMGLEVRGAINLAVGSTFDPSSGNVNLSGSATQNVPAGVYFDLMANGGGAKVLDGNVMVDNMLTLNNGNIVLNNFNLTLGAPELTAGGNVASYVRTNGTGSLIGMGLTALDSVTFNVGNSTYNPLDFVNGGTSDDFSVRVLDSVYVDGTGTLPGTVTFPVVNRTWLVEEATAGGSFVQMSPYWTPVEHINGFDPNWVYGIHHDGTMWESLIDSTLTGSPVTFGFGSHVYTTLDSLTDFSPYSVGSGTQFPLAVKLSDISAENVGKNNKVNWASSTEVVGSKYELQSSTDGRSFKAIATVNAKGEASTYTYLDEQAATGVNYYRIKLIDLDGKYAYSRIVTATVKASTTFSMEAYPNPVSSVVSVKINGTMSGNASIVVTDVTGKVIKSVKADNNMMTINMGDVASGVYFIKYSDDVNHESIKINKQ